MNVEQLGELDLIMQKRVVADCYHRMNIGQTMLSRDGNIKGVVTGVSSRYCAACERNHPCYLVTWEHGKKTKPCTKGVKELPHGGLQIV